MNALLRFLAATGRDGISLSDLPATLFGPDPAGDGLTAADALTVASEDGYIEFGQPVSFSMKWHGRLTLDPDFNPLQNRPAEMVSAGWWVRLTSRGRIEAARGLNDEASPPDELLADLAKQQRRMVEFVWDKPAVARRKFEAHVWKRTRVPEKKTVDRQVQRLADRLLELLSGYEISINDEFVKFGKLSAK